MTTHGLKLLASLLALGFLFGLICLPRAASPTAVVTLPADPAQSQYCSGCTGVQCPYGNCLTPPTVSPTLPKDIVLPSQPNFNCLAWQEFIALNWKAGSYPGQPDTTATAATFGQPNDFSPVVWMTYKESGEVFRPNATPPSPWGSPQQLPTSIKLPQNALRANRLVLTKGVGLHVLYSVSKSTDQEQQILNNQLQAGTNAWLTAQNGNVTYYEIRMNQDEFNYINQNKLYNANNQWSAVQQGGPGISLPDGTPGSSQYCPPSQYPCVGAIEVKAAWVEITDQSLWPKYFMADADIVDRSVKPPVIRPAKVGLVGLHIIHKTKNAQQFAWATFEHVSNDPDISQVQNNTVGPGPYDYYNTSCDPSKDLFKCQINYQPKSTDPMNAPVQVVRMNPIDNTTTNPLVGLNCGMQNMIRQQNPNSVFQYYQLVNVLWPLSNTVVQPGAKTPLPAGNPQPPPSAEKVANTTLETYLQQKVTCLDCHTRANIAKLPHQTATPPYASNYSFLFLAAGVPPAALTKPKSTTAAPPASAGPTH